MIGIYGISLDCRIALAWNDSSFCRAWKIGLHEIALSSLSDSLPLCAQALRVSCTYNVLIDQRCIQTYRVYDPLPLGQLENC